MFCFLISRCRKLPDQSLSPDKSTPQSKISQSEPHKNSPKHRIWGDPKKRNIVLMDEADPLDDEVPKPVLLDAQPTLLSRVQLPRNETIPVKLMGNSAPKISSSSEPVEKAPKDTRKFAPSSSKNDLKNSKSIKPVAEKGNGIPKVSPSSSKTDFKNNT